MKKLSIHEIESRLAETLRNWSYEDEVLKREFKFKSFVEAFSFMTAIALQAEKIDHHPDWTNIYNEVIIRLHTHSENGITSRDFELALIIDRVYSQYKNV